MLTSVDIGTNETFLIATRQLSPFVAQTISFPLSLILGSIKKDPSSICPRTLEKRPQCVRAKASIRACAFSASTGTKNIIETSTKSTDNFAVLFCTILTIPCSFIPENSDYLDIFRVRGICIPLKS
jgi:hypothetical protein